MNPTEAARLRGLASYLKSLEPGELTMKQRGELGGRPTWREDLEKHTTEVTRPKGGRPKRGVVGQVAPSRTADTKGEGIEE